MRLKASDPRPAAGGSVTVDHPADPALRARFEREALPHLDVVYSALARLSDSVEDAHDLTQETFVLAFCAFGSFQSGSNCRAWLLRIAYHAFCNDYRRRRRQTEPVLERRLDPTVDLAERLPAVTASTEQQTLARLDQTAVRAAVAQLPQHWREVVVLVDIHDLPVAEAAQVLGVAKGTVLSRRFRARKRLRELLTGHLDGDGR